MPMEIGIALIAAYGVTLTAHIGIAAFFYWRLGQVPTRREHNELRTELKSDIAELRTELKSDIAELRTELKSDIAQLRNEFKSDIAQLHSEVKSDIAQLREDMKADNALLREEFRRSHQQIMLALINHSHRDDGQTVFTLPPELEMTPAPADD